MIRRSPDAELHNRILNDPAITGHFGPAMKDLTPLFAEPGAYVLLDNGGDAACVFEWSAPRIWQSHTYFLPSARGKRGIETGKAFIRQMFDDGAKMLWGQTPLANRQARMFNRLIGAVADGIERNPAMGCDIEYFIVERDAWLHRQ
jgi:hypothetical protein